MRYWKRIAIFALTVLMAVTLSGCGKKEEDNVINLNDYIIYYVDGTNGDGTCYMEIDKERLFKENYQKVKPNSLTTQYILGEDLTKENQKKLEKAYGKDVWIRFFYSQAYLWSSYHPENPVRLSNGDIFRAQWGGNNEEYQQYTLETYGCIVVEDDVEYVIENLPEREDAN